MKRFLTLTIFVILNGMYSCKTQEVQPKNDFDALHQQFHGRYKIISSTSSEPLDVDLDGTSSVNMLQEMAELNFQQGKQYYVQLYVGQSKSESSFVFSQWWPEQYIRTSYYKEWNGQDLISYDPTHRISYAFQGSYRSFSFSSDLKTIKVKPNNNDAGFRWARPESVIVEPNARLRILNKRRIYTSSGVKEVIITTIYERFTIET